jgi:cytochrome c biogenesis protein CcmG/thiol:disulfide interchange protein DsbE
MDNNNSDDRWVEDRLAALRPNSEWQPDTLQGLARFRAQREKERRRKWGWSRLAVGAVAAAVPLMALPSTRAFAQRCVSACVSPSSWVYDLFAGHGPAASSGFVKPEGRKTAPDFVLDDASGKPVKLSDFRGKVVLLNFWATWCAPCRLEIPWFVEFQKAQESRGFATLGVSLDEDGWDAVNPYIDQHKINYRVMIGHDDVAQLYGANSLPTTLIIDRSGRIAATHVGICSRSEYEADIQAVLAEQ